MITHINKSDREALMTNCSIVKMNVFCIMQLHLTEKRDLPHEFLGITFCAVMSDQIYTHLYYTVTSFQSPVEASASVCILEKVRVSF